jgi:hypothetical protein
MLLKAGFEPRPGSVGQFSVKYLIRPVIPFDPNPSLRIVSWDLAIFIMPCHPTSPTIIIAGDRHSFPSSWNPFTSHFPVAWNIFPWQRIIIRFWRSRHKNWRWRKSG